MNLADALSTLGASLGSQLEGWDVNTSLIDYPKDKLVDVLFETFDFGYADMSTLVYSGRLSIYIYRRYKQSYAELLSALDVVLAWLRSYSHPSINIGDNTETVANIGVIDGTFDDVDRFRVIGITVPFEILAEA